MKSITPNELQVSASQLIGQQWMLITAGTPEKFNTMTASWGGLGFLWNRPVAFVFVRPNRHTRGFIDAQESFTLSFMPEKYREDLVYCGRHSGKDVDKMAETSLKSLVTESGLVAMDDADVVLECRKLYVGPMQAEHFLNREEVSPRFYSESEPLHLLYICELTDVKVRG